MEKNDNIVVIKKEDYTVAVDKGEQTVIVTYGRELLGRSKRSWLTWFIVCVVMAIAAFIEMTVALAYEQTSAVEYVLFAIAFSGLSGICWNQLAAVRRWLRAFK